MKLGGIKMKLKTMSLLIATGFCVGIVAQESISQLHWRNVAIGGEICFLPMVLLLIWFGWILRDEFKKADKNIRRVRNGSARRK